MNGGIQALREDVSIEEVLRYFGADLSNTSSGWNDWVRVTCPFCRDTNRSAQFNRGTGRFQCFQCGAPRDGRAGDIVDVVKWAVDIRDTKEAVQWLTRTFR